MSQDLHRRQVEGAWENLQEAYLALQATRARAAAGETTGLAVERAAERLERAVGAFLGAVSRQALDEVSPR